MKDYYKFSGGKALSNIIIAFDVDGTLEISGGPIPVRRLQELRMAGVVVGVVGNWELAIKKINALDFYQAGIPDKASILRALGAGRALKIYVGNELADKVQAEKAGWIFIWAKDFR